MLVPRLAFLAVPALALAARAQESAAIFDAPLVRDYSTERMDVLLDVDGDGFDDVIATTKTYYTIGFSVRRNDGTGKFVSGIYGFGDSGSGGGSYYGQADPYYQELDVNHDGREDFAFIVPRTQYLPGIARVFVSGTPVTRATWLDLSGQILDFAAYGDVDGDGDVDRVWISPAGHTLHLDLFEPNGTGGWTITSSTEALGFPIDHLLLEDMDGDGKLDACYEHSGALDYRPLVGGIGAATSLVHGITSMPMPMFGDIDNDGDRDFVVFDMTGYVVIRRTGPGSWSVEPRRTGGPAAKLADVNGDGFLDGICCGGGGDFAYRFTQPSTFRISLNDGTGNFEPAFTIPGLGSKEIAGAADLDHDGDVDLVAGQCVYYAHGPLTRPPYRMLSNGEQSQQSLFDFDGDGDCDFGAGVGTFRRHLGDGTSEDFQLVCPLVPSGESWIGPGLPGDWDGDGDTDLIVRREVGGVFASMRLLLNDGGGHYTDGGDAGLPGIDFEPPYVAGTPAASSLAYDLDLDGDLDLVTFVRIATQSPDGRMRTWLNDGSGHFALVEERIGRTPLAFGKLLGNDAWPDAVLSFNGKGDVRVVKGRGDGTFDESVFFTTYLGEDVGPRSVVVADFDHDGDDDLVTASQYGGYGWYSGMGWFVPNVNGDLSRTDEVLLDTLDVEYSGSQHVPVKRFALAGDVDGDGLLDVVLSTPLDRPSAISIVRRKHDNSGWEAPVRQVVFPAVSALDVDARVGALVDVDGDGDADLVNDRIWTNLVHTREASGARKQADGGVPDSNGLVPTLGATGTFRVGEHDQIRLTGAPGGRTGILQAFYPTAPAPFAQGHVWHATPDRIVAQIAFTTSGAAGQPGVGQWKLDYAVPGYVAGRTKVYQARIPDDSVPGGYVLSNPLAITYGP